MHRRVEAGDISHRQHRHFSTAGGHRRFSTAGDRRRLAPIYSTARDRDLRIRRPGRRRDEARNDHHLLTVPIGYHLTEVALGLRRPDDARRTRSQRTRPSDRRRRVPAVVRVVF